jgi:hypothetical protein
MYAILALLHALHAPQANLPAYLVSLGNIFEDLLVWLHAKLAKRSLIIRIARFAKETV